MLIQQKMSAHRPAQSRWFAEEQDCLLQRRAPWRMFASEQGLCCWRSVLWQSWWRLPWSCYCRTERRNGPSVTADGSMQVGRLERKGLGTQCLQIMQRIRGKGKPRGLAATDAMMVGTSWFFTCPWTEQASEHAKHNCYLLLPESHVQIFPQGRHVFALGQSFEQNIPLRGYICLGVPGTWSLIISIREKVIFIENPTEGIHQFHPPPTDC